MMAMTPSRTTLPKWQIVAIACLAVAWIGLTVPLILGGGDAEAFFKHTFKAYARSSHPYLSLNATFGQLWIAHSCLLIFSIIAMALRKADLFTVLIVGPTIAVVVAVLGASWSDPDWIVITSVCLIGCLVGLVTGGGYCVYDACMGKAEPRNAADSR